MSDDAASSEPIHSRTVARCLFNYARLLEAEVSRLSILDDATTEDLFGRVTLRLEDHADYIVRLARRLNDFKFTLLDTDMLVLLLEESARYIRTHDASKLVCHRSDTELLASIDRHVKQYRKES